MEARIPNPAVIVPGAMDALLALSREGPRAASVEQVDVEDEEPEGLEGFEVR